MYKLNSCIAMVCSDGAVLSPSNGRGGGIRGKIERINARRQEREQARQARKEICYGSYLTMKFQFKLVVLLNIRFTLTLVENTRYRVVISNVY